MSVSQINIFQSKILKNLSDKKKGKFILNLYFENFNFLKTIKCMT